MLNISRIAAGIHQNRHNIFPIIRQWEICVIRVFGLSFNTQGQVHVTLRKVAQLAQYYQITNIVVMHFLVINHLGQVSIRKKVTFV